MNFPCRRRVGYVGKRFCSSVWQTPMICTKLVVHEFRVYLHVDSVGFRTAFIPRTQQASLASRQPVRTTPFTRSPLSFRVANASPLPRPSPQLKPTAIDAQVRPHENREGVRRPANGRPARRRGSALDGRRRRHWTQAGPVDAAPQHRLRAATSSAASTSLCDAAATPAGRRRRRRRRARPVRPAVRGWGGGDAAAILRSPPTACGGTAWVPPTTAAPTAAVAHTRRWHGVCCARAAAVLSGR